MKIRHFGQSESIRLLRLISLILLMLAGNGCGPFYGIFIDPLIPAKPVPPEHDMQGKTVLIWIDEFATATAAAGHRDDKAEPTCQLRLDLTKTLVKHLQQHNAIGEFVDYERIIQFRREFPTTGELSVQDLGDKLNAQEVLYILIDTCHLLHEAGKGYYQAEAGGYCKVVDVATGSLLWPKNRTKHSFQITGRVTLGEGAMFELELRRKLSQDITQAIAPFFYEHK